MAQWPPMENSGSATDNSHIFTHIKVQNDVTWAQKLPTQSQMADGNLKVPNPKVFVQNAKFIVFHMDGKFLNFGTLENF